MGRPGVRHGYVGLIEGHFTPLNARSVGGIIQQGGTVPADPLPRVHNTGRSCQGVHPDSTHHVDGLIVVGGDGSQKGAAALSEMDIAVVGVASTIDNDLAGSDTTIGVDTALNIALEAIDRLKTTASSHQRAFLVEVMGRNCGYLALMAGIAGGAEVVAVPEVDTTPDAIAHELRAAYERGKAHALAVVAEGARQNAAALARYFREHHARIGFELRTTALGHVQRGGQPTAYDRLLATRLGAGAVEALARGDRAVLVGIIAGRVATTPFAEIVGKQKPLNPDLIRLADVLAR